MSDLELHAVLLNEVPPQPWRNGAGVTRELLALPSANDWRCRVSVADIDKDSPFSPFDGVQRWFAVIEGEGVALQFAGQPENTLTVAQQPLFFDGAEAPSCRLLAGPTRDLNLMLRGVAGGMQRVRGTEPWLPPAQQAGLFTTAGGYLDLADQTTIAVSAMSLVWLPAPPAGPLRFEAYEDAEIVPAWWLYCA
jgi:uncharacterized protein